METPAYSEQQVLSLAKMAYEHGSAAFEILTEKCALLVIDMQDEFVKPGWTPFWVPEATRQARSIRALIDHCRTKAIPIIYTAFGPTHHFVDRPRTGDSMPNRYPHVDLAHNNWFGNPTIWHEVGPTEQDILIYKPSYGAFYDTPLQSILNNLQKDTVIICGTLTNFCCGTTARQAYERGYKVIFGSDITSTDDPTMQEPELRVLRKGFAKVLTLAEIINQLK
jgi:nicotinamidase-related amidase